MIGFLFVGSSAADNLYIDAEEVGDGVVFTVVGSIDTTGFPVPVQVKQSAISGLDGIFPREGIVRFPAASKEALFDLYQIALPGLTPFHRHIHSGDFPQSSSGDAISISLSDPHLALPKGYVSGTPLQGRMVMNRHFDINLATLGIVPAPFTFQTEGGLNTIHMFTRTKWRAHSNLMGGKTARSLMGGEYDFEITHSRKIFKQNTASIVLGLENWGAPEPRMALRSFGDHHPGMRVTARLKQRNITAALRTGRYATSLGTDERRLVFYRLTTDRYFAGVYRRGDRNNLVSFKLRADGKTDSGTMEIRYTR